MANTELKVDVDVTGDQQLGRLERKLYRVNAAVKALGASSANIGKKYSTALNDHLTKTDGRWKKHFDDIDALIKKFGTATLGGLKLALKAAGVEMALMAVSMVALHGLFKIGHGIMNAYTGALNVLSGAAAGATIALAGVAAAMREQQAAMFAYRGNAMGSHGEFVTGMNKVRVVMRGLQTDSNLAAAGAANLDAAFAAVSRNSTFTRGSQGMLRGLMDFASTGDLKTGMQQAGELIAAIQDPKKSMGDIKGLGEKMGKPMKEALKGVQSRAQLIKAITSGSLAEAGGVTGQWDAVSGTLISRFKAAATIIKQDFADLGQEFLKPLKESLAEMINTFRQGMTQVWRPLVEFGRGPFLASLTGFAEKTTEMFVSFIRRGPEVEGMFKRIGDRWKGFVDGWNNVLDRLRPLIDGARILEGMFGEMFGAIGEYIRESFGSFNTMLQDNEQEVRKFGSRLGELFAAFGKFQNELKALFFQALPFINKILSGVRMIVDLLTSVMRSAGGMLGGLGDGAGAYGLLASAMVILSKLRSWAGGFLLQKQTNTMNVNAGVVNIGGAGGVTGVTAGGQLTPEGREAMDRRGMRSMTSQQQVDTRVRMHIANGGNPADLNSKGRPRGLRNYLMRPPGSPSGTQRVGSGLRDYREKWAGPRNRINNSMGMKMGAGMGIGMLSGMVGQESQGAMALGGMASFMNPMIGMGIAGLGTAATSQNAMHATMGGAAGGAAAGFQMFGGPWGALGGAIVGAAYGFMTAGGRKRAAELKAAREAGAGIATIIIEGMSAALETQSGVAGAKALTIRRVSAATAPLRELSNRIAMLSVSGSDAEKEGMYNELAADPAYADIFDPFKEKGITKDQRDQLIGAAGGVAAMALGEISGTLINTEKNVDSLTAAFGVGEEAILNMAAVTETELYSATVGWGTLAINLSQALVQNMREMEYASADRMSSRHEGLRRSRDALNAPLTMDEAASNIRGIAQSGSMSNEDAASVLSELATIDRAIGAVSPTQMAGERMSLETLGAGGTAFQDGGVFAGMEAILQAIPGFKAYQKQLGSDVTMQKVTAGESIFAQLTQAELKGFDMEGIRGALAGADMDTLELSGVLNKGAFHKEDGTLQSTDWIKAFLASAGIDVSAFARMEAMTDADLKPAADSFSEAVEAFVGGVNSLIAALPPPGGDTATPRRGMLNMKGLLGRSRRSDHNFGGAQDFFGSGLGALQSDIRGGGGYAEMHGVSRNRHLHGVPGASQGEGSSNSYVINVTGGDNATPAEIANEVMDRIDRRAVDMVERA
jgi:hypothetical protein